jgi:hypothetical protein
MSVSATSYEPAAAPPAVAAPPAGALGRLRAMAAGVGAAVLGAAPHVLHHVGPLAGAAVLAGATPGQTAPKNAPPGVSESEHEAHHR